MEGDRPGIPTRQEWARLGVHGIVELSEGHQSRTFSATTDAGRVAVKLTDANLVDVESFEARMVCVADLAGLDASVAAPVPFGERLVATVGDWLVTATEFAKGRAPDPAVAGDAESMGRALAGLHDSMRRVPAQLPTVAALRVVDAGPPLDAGAPQLVHGDFNATNLRLTDAGIRIFDLDDCGLGPIEFDIANALYMVLFDAVVNDESSAKYDSFRSSFVAGYSRAAGRPVASAPLDDFVDVRVRALGYWTENLAEAPIGIRTSSPEWIDVLKRFVRTWSERPRSFR